jgi:hypothetical protein
MAFHPGFSRRSRAPERPRRAAIRRAVRDLTVIGLLCSIVIMSTASVSSAVTRVTFGIEPASASGADGRPNFSFGATPGAYLTDHVAATNYSTIPLSLQIYAADAEQTSSGGFGLLLPTQRSVGVGAWIHIASQYNTVVVPARTARGPGQAVVPFVMRIPDNATPGDHVGGIIASLRTEGTNANGQRVVLDQRVGTRVFVLVSGALTSKLVVSNVRATYEGTLNPIGRGSVLVSYTVTNVGNIDLSVDQSVNASGLIDDSHRTTVPTNPLVLPNASLSERVVIGGEWPQFIARATVTATGVPVGETNSLSPATATASTWTWSVPWSLLVLIVLLIAISTWSWRRRSGRARTVTP